MVKLDGGLPLLEALRGEGGSLGSPGRCIDPHRRAVTRHHVKLQCLLVKVQKGQLRKARNEGKSLY